MQRSAPAARSGAIRWSLDRRRPPRSLCVSLAAALHPTALLLAGASYERERAATHSRAPRPAPTAPRCSRAGPRYSSARVYTIVGRARAREEPEPRGPRAYVFIRARPAAAARRPRGAPRPSRSAGAGAGLPAHVCPVSSSGDVRERAAASRSALDRNPAMTIAPPVVAAVALLYLHSCNSAGLAAAADTNIESCPIDKAEYFATVEVAQAAELDARALPPLHIHQGELLDTDDEAVRTGGTLWPAGQVCFEQNSRWRNIPS